MKNYQSKNDLINSCPKLDFLIKNENQSTPMVKQYIKIKTQYKEYVLLFRMGDFYEVFFEDAIYTSNILNIVLSHRGKITGIPIPMAGIPHHAANSYVDKIVAGGKKVAICEQIEDPKKAIGIVKRAVTQIITPGIPYNLNDNQTNSSHIILSVSHLKNCDYYISAIDYTTGDFYSLSLNSFKELIEEIDRMKPKEILSYIGQFLENQIEKIAKIINMCNGQITYLGKEYFNHKVTSIYIEKFIPHYKNDKMIVSRLNLLNSLGALTYYMQITQKDDKFQHIKIFKLNSQENFLKVTYKTLEGFEIITSDSKKLSLLKLFNKTKSAMGARYLNQIFKNPLNNLQQIKNRQNIISLFLKDRELIDITKDTITGIKDINRILAQINRGKPSPSDLLNLSQSISKGLELTNIPFLDKIIDNDTINNILFNNLDDLQSNIIKTINQEIKASLDSGNLINHGISKERDSLYNLAFKSQQLILDLEQKYIKQTGISKLKIKNNNVFGYFIEVQKTKSNLLDPTIFTRKQTLVNSERFSSPELISIETEVFEAKDNLKQVEKDIYQNIINQILERTQEILIFSDLIAKIDAFRSLSEVAFNQELSCPNIESHTKDIKIEQMWHPIIKDQLKSEFIPHDLNLNDKKHFALITGPNMAGKTTVMRELAIVTILAQIGSFVPAKSASLPLFDALFSRLGASDDISEGLSTFMVEMSETAEIIRHATSDSLIILDELGRGTSTYDGLSIACSISEYLIQKTKAFTLFATHYHELIEVIEKEKGATNFTVETIGNAENVEFTYKLIEEPASESYGIYVAKLAGLPSSIIKRSNEILSNLEKEDNKIKYSQLEQHQNNYTVTQDEIYDKLSKEIKEQLKDIDIFNTTPLQAMSYLENFKKMLSTNELN